MLIATIDNQNHLDTSRFSNRTSARLTHMLADICHLRESHEKKTSTRDISKGKRTIHAHDLVRHDNVLRESGSVCGSARFSRSWFRLKKEFSDWKLQPTFEDVHDNDGWVDCIFYPTSKWWPSCWAKLLHYL